MQRSLRLRGEDLSRNHIGRQIRPEVREEKGQPINDDEEDGTIAPQVVVAETADAEPHRHIDVPLNLHVLAAQLVDEGNAHKIARQHHEDDQQVLHAHLLLAFEPEVDYRGDVAIKEPVRVEDDVKQEPIARGAQHVPCVAPHGQAEVDTIITVLTRTLDLLKRLALVHLHPEVQGDHRDDCSEREGEAPREFRRRVGERQREADDCGEQVAHALVGEHERHERAAPPRSRAFGADRRRQRVLATDAEAQHRAAHDELRHEDPGPPTELLHACRED
mmetsp:Transcript_116277/g.335876  ORF Transcript_116277/g.335876 Transcript_116277/m.335876 type:complete len:276 (+) Transcript_116277:632-1459(+)